MQLLARPIVRRYSLHRPLSSPLARCAALQKAGVPSEHHVIPGARHGAPEFNDPKILDMVDAFFRKRLNITSTASPKTFTTAEPPASQKPDIAAPSDNASTKPIVITEFKREGERWTCLANGKPMSGILLMPEGKGPFPAVLISHGMGSTAARFATPKAREFVKWGFVCIATDYTHANPAMGGGRRPAPNAGPVRPPQNDFGASAENIRRARACLAVLRTLPEVDGKRLCAYGNSMGAFLTIGLAAAEPNALAAAAITAGGVNEVSGFPAPARAEAAKIRTPFLVLHGTNDQTVPPERSALLERTLREKGTPVERRLFEGIGHNLHNEKSDEVYRAIQAWFTKYTPAKP